MAHYKLLPLLILSVLLSACWKYRTPYDGGKGTQPPLIKVWGYKPIYGADTVAKRILYSPVAQPVSHPGNIYAFGDYILQMDDGLGIHVIDNHDPADAKRIGFISTKGCSQISIKDNKLYTNNYDDLVVLDFSNLNDVKEYSRLKGVFVEYRYGSPIARPPGTGYYECPRWDSLVVGWVKDSVYQHCYNN